MPLSGRRVALAEGRQLEELASLLEKEGAVPLRFPLLSMLDPPDDAPALGWIDELSAGTFAWVVLFTGEGVRRLIACAERHGRRQALVDGLGRSKLLTRGPKPGKALQEIGVKPTRVAAAPTTDGVIASLAELPLEGTTVGVQLYRDENPPLMEHLVKRGVSVRTVLPYVYAPASDAERVAELIRGMAQGTIDAIVFTSSPQVDRLFDVAVERGLETELRGGIAKTRVAAVGPLVAQNLTDYHVRVDVCPEQGWVMKNLVLQMRRAFAE